MEKRPSNHPYLRCTLSSRIKAVRNHSHCVYFAYSVCILELGFSSRVLCKTNWHGQRNPQLESLKFSNSDSKHLLVIVLFCSLWLQAITVAVGLFFSCSYAHLKLQSLHVLSEPSGCLMSVFLKPMCGCSSEAF